MMTTCCDSRKTVDGIDGLPSVEKIAVFLAGYAALLMGCGATCIRVEKNTRRMATAFGLNIDVSMMPAHVYVAVLGENGEECCVAMRPVPRHAISFSLNARLSRLSWEVADRRLDFSDAEKVFGAVERTPATGKWETLLLASLANASFCRLFGGDSVAMLIVFLSTLVGFRLKQIMIDDHRDVRLTFLCASFFSASLSAAGHVFGIGATPGIALGTSVLYLIPGVPYINAVSDLFDRHYLCAFSRFADAAVLTVCLSLGLCAGMLLLNVRN